MSSHIFTSTQNTLCLTGQLLFLRWPNGQRAWVSLPWGLLITAIYTVPTNSMPNAPIMVSSQS